MASRGGGWGGGGGIAVLTVPHWPLDKLDFAIITNGVACLQVNAQLSFHGHRDSVKFFVAVPGSMKRVSQPPPSTRSASPSGLPVGVGGGGGGGGGEG